MRILIVDDNEINRKLLRVTLQAEDYDTLEAADGQEALQVLERENVDVIISDILMPNMDGYRLCYEVRKSERLKTIPFIVFSSTYDSAKDEKLALQFGADKFIRRPAPAAEIFQAIREVTGQTKQHQVPVLQPLEEAAVMKAYSEQFVKKLEDRNIELEHAYARIRGLNAELEQRIVERTAELQVVNEELEAFSYSVSHDLRAPLRAIDGFSQALLEDYDGVLDDQGKEYLQRVRAGTQRMAALIDDLLMLSRVSRKEIKRERIDLSALAESICQDLQEREPDRKVTFSIARSVLAFGDPSLLRIVLDNLLGNAWKFTSRRPRARIAFGVAPREDGREAFFVKDNGVGFDMAYAGKLFGAFQRLHNMNEFPGTGIGLAIVQRIIRRHGGKVWAEAAVDKGATFYFTL